MRAMHSTWWMWPVHEAVTVLFIGSANQDGIHANWHFLLEHMCCEKIVSGSVQGCSLSHRCNMEFGFKKSVMAPQNIFVFKK